MSETNKKHVKRHRLAYLSMAALLVMLISWQPIPVASQDLSAYGAEMCAEVGIPADQCTLSGPGGSQENEGISGDKTATLVEHGRRVCAQEGVPLEDCRALPLAHRETEETILPAASFLTVPDRLPAPDPRLVPPPVIVDAPIPAGQQGVGYARPSAPQPAPPPRYVSPPPVDPGYRYVEEPRYREALPLYVEQDLPPSDFGYRAGRQPVEPSFRAFRQPPPAGPAVRFEGPSVPVVERRERLERRERFDRQERLRGEDRFRRDFSSGRCLREIRYSRPPSYRYVTC